MLITSLFGNMIYEATGSSILKKSISEISIFVVLWPELSHTKNNFIGMRPIKHMQKIRRYKMIKATNRPGDCLRLAKIDSKTAKISFFKTYSLPGAQVKPSN